MIFPTIKKKNLQRRRSKSNDVNGNIRFLYEKRQRKKGDSSSDELENIKSSKKKKRNSVTIKSPLVNNESVLTLNSTVDESLFKNPKNSPRLVKLTEQPISHKNSKIFETTQLKLTKMSEPTPINNLKYPKNSNNRTILLSENCTKQKSHTEAGSKSSKSDASIHRTDYLQVPNFFRKH